MFSDFFAMGGYGAYIWPAYGLVTLVLLAMLIVSLFSLRKSEQVLALLQSGEARKRKPASENSTPETTADTDQDPSHEAQT